MLDTNEPIDVVLIDDHWLIRHGVRATLEEPSVPPIRVLGEAATADKALALVKELVPDVLLADLKLGTNFYQGLELIRMTRRLSPHTRVLVLTAYDSRDHVLEALRAGASGCLSKAELQAGQLRSALLNVVAGLPVFSPMIYERINELSANRESGDPLTIDPLTERELDVLAMLGTGAKNREIAEQLVISEKTVKTHVSNILSKLHLQSRHQASDHYHEYYPQA